MTAADYEDDEQWEEVTNSEIIERVKKCLIGTESNRFEVSDVYKVPDTIYKDKFHYVVRVYAGRNGDGEWTSYLQDMQRIFEAIEREFNDAWLIEWKNRCANDTSAALIGISDK